ncbi:MAG TPA: hypothetical protein V6C78_27065 [Crinalium sp.]|jgi:hypothetical protein
MTSYDTHLNYERLTHTGNRETKLDTLPNRTGDRILSTIKTIAHNLFAYFTSGSEPRIRKVVDHTGITYWDVYDPYTNRSARLTSEKEVIIWLEGRY